MLLHHFTSTWHLDHILSDGLIRPSESNLHARIARYGPDVVWLLDVPTVEHSHGLENEQVDKTQVRFTLDLPGIPWDEWVWAERMDPRWREAIIQSGGGEEAALHWYVWPAPVRRNRWREVAIKGPSGAYSPLEEREWQS